MSTDTIAYEIIRQNEISFSVSRYMTSSELNNDYETVPLGEVCSFQGGSQPPKENFIYLLFIWLPY